MVRWPAVDVCHILGKKGNPRTAKQRAGLLKSPPYKPHSRAEVREGVIVPLLNPQAAALAVTCPSIFLFQ